MNKVSKELGLATAAEGALDVADAPIPGLDILTQGLTLATGLGTIIASVFDKPKEDKELPPQPEPEVGEQFGE